MRTCFALGLALIAGCAAQSEPAQVPADHPANPSAAAAPLSPPSETLAAGADGAGTGTGPRSTVQATSDGGAAHDPGDVHDGHGMTPAAPHASPAATVAYTCPHHPEVVSDKPGECPKCHMTLRPKAVSAATPSARPATTPAATPHGRGSDEGHGDHGGHGGHP